MDRLVETYGPGSEIRSIASVWSDQVSAKCQQPGFGMSMPDGPGPPVTVRLTVSVVPSSVAVISSEPPGVTGTRDTHRILLDRSGAGGELSVPPNSTPRMSPCRPTTCGTPAPSPENPARAHVGRGPV